MHIGAGFERLIYFFLSFVLVLHLVACLWLVIGKYEYGIEDSWIDGDVAEYDSYD